MIIGTTEQNQPIIQVDLPKPHLTIRLVRANETYFIANRGGFKTTRGISFYNLDCVYEMTGSTGIICGPSYEHLGDNTLNPLFNAFDEFGFQQGVHYVVGTRPPESWPLPLIRVNSKKYDHIISWHNGSNQFLVSMEKRGSANGISAQWGIFDEIKLFNEKDLQEVVFPAFRGNEKHFEQSPLFMSKFFASDKLGDPSKVQWFLKKRDLNDQKKLDIIITLQLELSRLKSEYNEAGINRRHKIKPQIEAIEVRLSKLRRNTTLYIESSAEDTVKVLGERWLEDKRKTLKEYEFKVSILNEDPDRPADGFYPDFNPAVHCYDIPADYDPVKPLIIAADYQHSVSPICVAQIGKLPGQQKESLNYIDEVYTLAPQGLEEAVQQFCDRYKMHNRKFVYYIYDQTATGRRNNADEYFKIVVKTLQRNKWSVRQVYTGQAPTHYLKWNETKGWLRNEQAASMDIRINKARCKKTVISINFSPAISNRGKTEKLKKYEDTNKFPHLDQSETTHFSDVFDQVNYAVLKLKLIRAGGAMGSPMEFR